ncbi:hypothetical protein FXO38_04264 [Capsicum annuum]|nr:hypothetical protein FXO38_04264 [Capsicum annuum]
MWKQFSQCIKISQSRMTLLLGPLGYGKTTLLKALSGSLEKSLKAIFVEGQKTNIQTDYILKILGLDICADTLVGDAMRRELVVRFLASVFRTMDASIVASGLSILFVLLFSGFIIPRSSMPIWLKWGFWISPLTYGEIGLAVNEFLAPRWQKSSDAASGSISPMDARRSRDDNDPNDIL